MPPLDDLLLLNAVLTYVLEANVLLDMGMDGNTEVLLGSRACVRRSDPSVPCPVQTEQKIQLGPWS